MKKVKTKKMLLVGVPLVLLLLVLIYYTGRFAGGLLFHLTNQ
ncbi:MAG TPA: hypothetical protein VIR29_02460 [Anseongella sp.]